MEKIKHADLPAHTPGPWIIYDDGFSDDSSDVVQSLTGDPKDDICSMIDDRPVMERKANACLIAAAPELLAALKTLTYGDTVDRRDYEHAESVIAKAEGE